MHDEVTAGSGDCPSGTARVVELNYSRLYRRRNPSTPPSKEPLITEPEED